MTSGQLAVRGSGSAPPPPLPPAADTAVAAGAPRFASAAPARLTAGQHALVLALSLALVCLFTYPLVLDPGHLLPKHKDPFMYGWTMVSNVHRLLSAPLAVFHGNTFYPHGNTIAYTDLLLTPTLFPAGPVYLLTGNPVLQYNVALLVWWALSGWAMYVLAFSLFRSHPAAILAAIGFTLCPFRTDFFLEFQMELAFPIPLAVLALLRFLETGRWRPAGAVVLLLWIEALASMYYAIILALGLVVVAGLHALLRRGAWSAALAARGLVAALVLGAVLAPFLVPYVQNQRELGMERALRQPTKHYADVLTYLETGVAKLYQFRPTGHIAESSLFMGFVALALAAVASVWPLARAAPDPPWLPRARLALTLALAAGIAGFVAVAGRAAVLHRPPRLNPQRFLDAVLLLGLGRIALEGWVAARAGRHREPLGERELRWVCLYLIVLFFDLSLGGWIQVARQEVGTGLYYHLYRWLVPLHAMRITSRIGVVVVLAVSLLAGLGLKLLLARLPGPRARIAVTAACALLLLAEYRSFPLPYQRIEWETPPALYRALAADPDDVAVLEWPLGWEYLDDADTFWSTVHWKRLVNGASGFLPPITHEISAVLSRPETPGVPFPGTAAVGILTGIHPLRYVVVHNDFLPPDEQAKWRRLRAVPWARHIESFGAADLYRLTGEAVGQRVEKLFSWDYARTRRAVAFQVRSVGPAAAERWVEVELNGRPLGRQAVGDGWQSVTLALDGPLRHSAPNRLAIVHRYRGHDPGRRDAIGGTGVLRPPVDLHVASGGHDAGNRASLLVDGAEQARNSRGYNVVALHPVTGAVLWSDAFDTYGRAAESGRLGAAIAGLPGGTVVAAAVRDEASASLTGEGVAALRAIGAREDLRGRYRASHVVVGVKGAPPGSALEQAGDRPLELTLGTPPTGTGIEVRDFDLR